MYKYLLCWKYLRGRYIALASVVSVMLGVATLIVVNAVMAGFATKMRSRLHGFLSDIVVMSYDRNGFANADEVTARIREIGGDDIEATAGTMETYAILRFYVGGSEVTKEVKLIGVKPEERAKTGDFAEFLFDENDRPAPASFEVSEELRKKTSPAAGVLGENMDDDILNQALRKQALDDVPPRGAILGYAMATARDPEKHRDEYLAPRGTKVMLVFARASKRPEPATDEFTVVSFFKSGMSEYDSSIVFVPLERLQFMLGMGDGEGRGAVNQIHIKLKPGSKADLNVLARKIQRGLERLRPLYFKVATWEEMQGPLLAAVSIEQDILNMLLFFIIAVAGFGILAIFSMIVVEKTRDIGVLKALGASTTGVGGIFLGYGLALGIVGAGTGLAGGLLFVRYINKIEDGLSALTGQRVFNPDIYYFSEIPTRVEPWTVAWVFCGALLIAVLASVWPAIRAARLRPVEALRYE